MQGRETPSFLARSAWLQHFCWRQRLTIRPVIDARNPDFTPATVSYAFDNVKASVTVTFRLLSHAFRVAPRTSRVRWPITKAGKQLLRAAAKRKGYGPGYIAKRVGRTSPAITQLFAEESKGKTRPTMSSPFLPELCELLGVSFWACVAGLDPDQERAMAALALVEQAAPDRYTKFIADLAQDARDIALASGWRPGSDDVENDTEHELSPHSR